MFKRPMFFVVFTNISHTLLSNNIDINTCVECLSDLIDGISFNTNVILTVTKYTNPLKRLRGLMTSVNIKKSFIRPIIIEFYFYGQEVIFKIQEKG